MKIAITGGIGSGKSTVSKILKSLGYKVYSADDIYEDLIKNAEFVREVYDALSLPVPKKDGVPYFDRAVVSRAVFSDKEKLRILNEVTHAKVYARIEELVFQAEANETLFFEIPLLFESGKEKEFDRVIVVMREKRKRLSAVLKRSGLSESDVLLRMDNQINYDNFDFSGHTLIYNDGDIRSLESEVIDALKSFGI